MAQDGECAVDDRVVLARERPGGQRSVGPHSCVFVRTVVVNVNVIGVDAVSDGDGRVDDDFARSSDVLVGQDAAVAFPRPRPPSAAPRGSARGTRCSAKSRGPAGPCRAR